MDAVDFAPRALSVVDQIGCFASSSLEASTVASSESKNVIAPVKGKAQLPECKY